MSRMFLPSHKKRSIRGMSSMTMICLPFIVAIVIGLIALVYLTFQNNDLDSKIEQAYNVRVVEREVHWTKDNKLIIEKDDQKLTCEIPSPKQVENKTPLNCEDPKPVKKIDAS